ncbi:glycosyl hydrolase family 5 [Siphonobacter sp. BAB-5405]|uniref:cellulase family glycosylhydrolase n=1 Tax=Siphonobacter sp. BAB-5405 TaxID=1864825 RepID=UPI000C80B9FD|nr:cellulase family glycosylhydrolase [Siphonobacter sp. BAB-5405]PMD91648.1 glycosyl hydrolase family 5 [Siphonobacter sp. BAB-5405]
MIFRKRIQLLVGVALATLCSLTASGQGYLKAQGTQLVDRAGKKIILRGMGLGGWMLQEGYMFRLSNLGQQYRIKAAISELIGPEKTEAFYTRWLNNHTRKIDIDSMAAWGFNSIRLPMHYNLYTLPTEQEPVTGQHTWLETGFALTDSLLNWCEANQVYLILDLHATPGGQGNDLAISDRDPSKPSLWQSEANQQKTIALWRKLAERYANHPWIGGYDIINEPNWGFEDPKDVRGTAEKKNIPLRKLMVEITQAIREVDKNHLIIIEGNGFGNNYEGILPTWDSNMALSFHKYGNFNNQEAIQKFLTLRDTYKVPIWLGESGENSNTWFTDAIGLMERHDIGWCWWQEKKMGINNPLEIKVTPGYEQLLAYWSGKGAKPSAAEAERILNELLENLKLENNRFHPDVVDALFRQVQSSQTRPFATHQLRENTVIKAVDFDLGRQRSAYFDTDSASYHYTPGVNTVGNRGRQYRNDGVDIEREGDRYYISHSEAGEWLQYTVQAEKAGTYQLSFRVASPGGTLSVDVNGKRVVKAMPLGNQGEAWSLTPAQSIRLNRGVNTLRVYVDKGGFKLESLHFNR